MAVSENFQSQGIGKILIEYCFDFAKQNNISEIILYSNTKLEAAIHLYKKMGFTEIPVNQDLYKRANIKMKKIL
jgi:ribosomal protein S18 acetylase RimI-like enzyme